MENIDFLSFKEDWTYIKRMLISVAVQLEDNHDYIRERAIGDLIDIIQEMDKREPKKD
ncbi:hypothetical protein MXL46_08715 [Heyndrickxia sporothermodurans]|uniref:Uncharacterized protein n=1 Tax=Heyndrickxia sporothermodurans TaxID=46224 RepID=A0A150LH97_9BACI|nr:hypothetical protein [Heyndrickxia sporothermodurans]KYD11697.1 hypothetical protein B4102_2082 [Heyndrickxia sporothermodurans]MBL5768170.1 hypothetical protein [Heyndrickxia sporothermodurans]MBL5771823.1 hypothetical protein [Heyndrickxia sporothermodurans]MBL5775452.1 hypothetical protein [Heyndrickxia sporothermodurans]MBL5778764.1 hypothetical protein [Heyndrickxia sporothermodurans]